MKLRERGDRDPKEKQQHPSEDPASGDLGELSTAGADLLRAGDEAIKNALSGNSEAFLAANQQQGGQ